MARLVFLGTSSAVAAEGRENTHLVLVGSSSTVLIDCGGNPVRRLSEAGIAFQTLTDLVVTHFHPDHVSGLPLLLMDLWILGRKAPLQLYGSQHSLERVHRMMDLFDWQEWDDFYPVIEHPLPLDVFAPALENEDFMIYSSPVAHLVPTLGLRIEHKKSGFTVAYSADTDPCPEMVSLAANVDVLVHEAGGSFPGHTTPSEAGEIAQKANAEKLYLVHYPLYQMAEEELLAAARQHFSGEVILAVDFMEIELGNSG